MGKRRDYAREMHALRQVQELLALTMALVKDVTATAEDIDLKRPGRQRAYVRSVFALAEGALNAMCTAILELQPLLEWTLPEEEVATLSDGRREMEGATPEPGRRRRFSPLPERLRVAFRVSERVLGERARLDLSGTEWPAFKNVMDLRNRLMHPRGVADLEVTHDDLVRVDAARDWLRFGVMRFFQALQAEIIAVYGFDRGA